MNTNDLKTLTLASKPIWITFCSLFVLYSAATFLGLESTPRVWIDEGWIAETGFTVASGGHLGSPSHGDRFQFSSKMYWNGPLASLVLGGVYSLGLEPLMGGRALCGLFGLGTLLLLLLWTMELLLSKPLRTQSSLSGPTGYNGGTTNLILALLFVGIAFTLDPFLWKVHRTIRYESILGFWTVAAFYGAWRGRGSRGALITGLFAGLAVLTHPNGALTAAGAVGILWSHRNRFIPNLLWMSLALAAALVPWLVYLAADANHDYANLIGQNAPHFAERSSLAENLSSEWKRYRSYFQLPYLGLPLALWVLTLIWAAAKRAPFAVLFPIAVYLGGLALLPNKTELYLALAAPLIFVAAAWAGSRSRRKFAPALLGDCGWRIWLRPMWG